MNVAEASREYDVDNEEAKKRILAALGQNDWSSITPAQPTETTTAQAPIGDVIASMTPSLSPTVAPAVTTTGELLKTAGALEATPPIPMSSGDQRQSALISSLSAAAPALTDSYGASMAVSGPTPKAELLKLPTDDSSYGASFAAAMPSQPLQLPGDEAYSTTAALVKPPTPELFKLPETGQEAYSTTAAYAQPDVRRADLVSLPPVTTRPDLETGTEGYSTTAAYAAPTVRRAELIKLPEDMQGYGQSLAAAGPVPRAQPVLDDQGNIVMRAQSVTPGKIVMQPPVPAAYPNVEAGTPAALPVATKGMVVSRYGYAGDATFDENSGKGIGDRDNSLTPGVSVALTPAARQQILGVTSNKSTGREFTYQGKKFRDDDTSPASGANLDVFDPFYSGLDKGVSADLAARRRAAMPAYAKAQPTGAAPGQPQQPAKPVTGGEGLFGDLSKGPPGAPPATGTKDAPYWPKSDKDVKLLPSGATYIDPNDRSIKTVPGEPAATPQQPGKPAQAVTSFTNPNGTSSPTRALAPNGQEPKAVIFHTTDGRPTVDGVRSTLSERHVGVQYIVDRDGNLVQGGGDGKSQILKGWGAGAGYENNNTVGVEFIARNDKDLTPAQLETAKKIGRMYPNSNVLGHGEVNPGHRDADEGASTKAAVLADRGGQTTTTTAATTTQQPTIGGKSLSDQVEALINQNNEVKMPKAEEIAKDDLFGQAKLQALKVAKSMQDAGIPVDREKLGALITSSFTALQSQQVEIAKEQRAATQQVAVEAAKRALPTNMSPADAKLLADSESSYGMLDNIEQLYEKARAKNVAGSEPVAALTGLDPDAIALESAIKGAMTPVAKGIYRNTGNLSEMEQKNALESLPRRGDSPVVFKAKMDNLRLQIANGQIANLESFKKANIETSAWEETLKKNIAIRDSIKAKFQNAPGTNTQAQAVAQQQKAEELRNKQVPDRTGATSTTTSTSTASQVPTTVQTPVTETRSPGPGLPSQFQPAPVPLIGEQRTPTPEEEKALVEKQAYADEAMRKIEKVRRAIGGAEANVARPVLRAPGDLWNWIVANMPEKQSASSYQAARERMRKQR